MARIKVFTWPVHGSYMTYLARTDCDFYIPCNTDGTDPRSGQFTNIWGSNVISLPRNQIKSLKFDCVLFQSRPNYEHDQYDLLSAAQRQLPKIYIEHDPPRETPTDTKHFISDPEILIVHVTHFNKLMWDCGPNQTKVIEHGVYFPKKPIGYTGRFSRGVTVINNIKKRGRRLGLDIFLKVKDEVPIDYFGMGYYEVGGQGEVGLINLGGILPDYRFFFYPVRYTSFGLAVCEAMMMGLPIIALATTEMSLHVKNGITGFIHTDVNYLIEKMQELIANPELAKSLGNNAKQYALEAFDINRFAQEWLDTFRIMSKKTTFLQGAYVSIHSSVHDQNN